MREFHLTQHQNHTLKAIVYFIFGLVLFVIIGVWLFFSYFFEDMLNKYAIPKLEEAALTATHGIYRLKLEKIYYRHHRIFCSGFDLTRVRYDSGAKGIAVKRVQIDTVEFTGVNLWKILIGKGIAMTSLQMDSPRVYMTDLSLEKPTPKDLTYDSLQVINSVPKKMPVISFDSIALRDIRLYMAGDSDKERPSFRGIMFRLTDFSFNSETKEAQPVLFSKRADLAIPNIRYPIGDGMYSLEFRNLRGNSEDSLMTIDTFGYVPNYSEDAFAAKHTYAKGRLNFRSTGIRFEGINFVSSFSKANIVFRKLTAHSWNLDSYEDRGKPADPSPPPALLPNAIISGLPVKVDVDSIILNNGRIRIQERKGGESGSLGFDRVRLVISPISKDTMSPRYLKPAIISINALFVGEAPLNATFTYPMHQKDFNMDVHATVGSFSAKKLNSWLVPLERLEVADGNLKSGKIDMTVRSGTATTTVTPIFDNLKLKVLAKDPNKKPGLMEKIETLAAGFFVVEDENPGASGKLKIGTTTSTRTKDQEFLEFTWIALRKSLGAVIGGFK